MKIRLQITRLGKKSFLGSINPNVDLVTHKLSSSEYTCRDITANAIAISHKMEDNRVIIHMWECRTNNLDKISEICNNALLGINDKDQWKVCYKDYDVTVEYFVCDLSKPRGKVKYFDAIGANVIRENGKKGNAVENILKIAKQIISGVGAWSPDVICCCECVYVPNEEQYDCVNVHKSLSNCDKMVKEWFNNGIGVRFAIIRKDNDYELWYKDQQIIISSREIDWDTN